MLKKGVPMTAEERKYYVEKIRKVTADEGKLSLRILAQKVGITQGRVEGLLKLMAKGKV